MFVSPYGKTGKAVIVGVSQLDDIVSGITPVDVVHYWYNKKLSCRRETVRCFVSLNISLSHCKIAQGP